MLGAITVFLSFINIGGGFKITSKMIDLFTPLPTPSNSIENENFLSNAIDNSNNIVENNIKSSNYYIYPVLLFTFGLLYQTILQNPTATQLPFIGGITASLLCISAIQQLSNQKSASQGNLFGMYGVYIALITSLSAQWMANPAQNTLQVVIYLFI